MVIGLRPSLRDSEWVHVVICHCSTTRKSGEMFSGLSVSNADPDRMLFECKIRAGREQGIV